MSLLNPFNWGVKGAPEKKSHNRSIGLDSVLNDFFLFGKRDGAETPGSALRMYEQSTAVSVPVNWIADNFASIRPILKEIETHKIIRDSPVLNLLNRPHKNSSAIAFRKDMAAHYLITGNTYIVAVGNINRPPIELMPISPKDVSVVQGGNGQINNIVIGSLTFPGSYTENTGKKEGYSRDSLTELKQIRSFSTRNNSLLQGQSVLLSAADEVRQNIEGNRHNLSLLTNGGRVSLVFAFEKDMSTDDAEAIKVRLENQYSGADRAGKIAVTSDGSLDIKELGKTNKDMDFAILHQMTKQAVALAYKFPLPILSTDAATMNNMENAKTALYDDAVLPLADVIFEGLSTWLLPRFGIDPDKFHITYDIDQITALSGRRQSELKLRNELNIDTPNEMRTLVGQEPLEGGDTLMVSATMVPLGTDIFTDDNIPANAIDRDGA